MKNPFKKQKPDWKKRTADVLKDIAKSPTAKKTRDALKDFSKKPQVKKTQAAIKDTSQKLAAELKEKGPPLISKYSKMTLQLVGKGLYSVGKMAIKSADRLPNLEKSIRKENRKKKSKKKKK